MVTDVATGVPCAVQHEVMHCRPGTVPAAVFHEGVFAGAVGLAIPDRRATHRVARRPGHERRTSYCFPSG
jgi:hypothetical protein